MDRIRMRRSRAVCSEAAGGGEACTGGKERNGKYWGGRKEGEVLGRKNGKWGTEEEVKERFQGGR